MPNDVFRSCIVSCKSENEVVVESTQEIFEVAHAPIDVLVRIERVGYSQIFGCAGHELHEAHGPFGGYGSGIETGLNTDDGLHQVLIQTMAKGGPAYVVIEARHIGGRQGPIGS